MIYLKATRALKGYTNVFIFVILLASFWILLLPDSVLKKYRKKLFIPKYSRQIYSVSHLNSRFPSDVAENIAHQNAKIRNNSKTETSANEKTCLNIPKIDCYPELGRWLDKLVSRRAPANDDEVVRFAQALIDPPSTHAIPKMPWRASSTPQSEYIDSLLKQQEFGFFIEAGAQDGERSSNTKWLEVERGWTGLLVEIDPWFYTQMRGKARHAFTANACLSPTDYITKLTLSESDGGAGHVVSNNSSSLLEHLLQPLTLPCLPVYSLLAALNQTTVDYFSLDVEGMEYSVLTAIPFHKLNIRTLSVEYSHSNETMIVDFMASQGYRLQKKIYMQRPELVLYVDDYIFVRDDLVV